MVPSYGRKPWGDFFCPRYHDPQFIEQTSAFNIYRPYSTSMKKHPGKFWRSDRHRLKVVRCSSPSCSLPLQTDESADHGATLFLQGQGSERRDQKTTHSKICGVRPPPMNEQRTLGTHSSFSYSFTIRFPVFPCSAEGFGWFWLHIRTLDAKLYTPSAAKVCWYELIPEWVHPSGF